MAGEASFEITRSERESGGRKVQILALKGQLDAYTFSSLQGALEEVSGQRGQQPRVILDCQQLEYISSAGLGVLNKMTKEFRGREGDIRLARLPDKIRSIVDLLGFSQVIQVFGDLEQAVGSFAAKR